jgi:hypothetical protein
MVLESDSQSPISRPRGALFLKGFHPSSSFKIYRDTGTLLQTQGSRLLTENLTSLFGLKFTKTLVGFTFQKDWTVAKQTGSSVHRLADDEANAEDCDAEEEQEM